MTGHGKTSIETDASCPVPGAMGTTTPRINWRQSCMTNCAGSLARYCLHRERPGHSLQATAPVNEADLRLVRLQRDAMRPHNAVFVV